MIRRFEPWVGRDYCTGGILGTRLLVLGESHYGGAERDTPAYTREVVDEWVYQKRSRFFTVIAKTILPDHHSAPLSFERRREFYDSVAFYNYVQRFPGTGPRQRPSDQMWQEAAVPFLGVLEELRPQVVLSFGKELWQRLPRPAQEVVISQGTGDEQVIRYYATEAGRVAVGRVQHPSSRGFRYAEWQPRIHAILAAASA